MADAETDRILIDAEPESVGVDFTRTAILVVDMQNAFVKKGGYFDAVGIDITATEKIIRPCRKIIGAGREKGIKIIYLQMGFSRDLSDRGPKESPGFYKSRVTSLLTERPELRDKLYTYGTWGAEIIEELTPRQEDIVVRKQRYDGFIGTNLDLILRTLGIKFVVFIGTATNICVESTLRHAFFLDYFPILVSDAVSQKGADIMQEATILNVQANFGWVTTSYDLVRAMGRAKRISKEGSPVHDRRERETD